jgi:hypothetical protein
MNRQLLVVLICFLSIGYGRAHSFGAAPPAAPGKSAVETKDYLFVGSKDEIVAKAKQEGKLEVLTFLEADAKKAMVDAFSRKAIRRKASFLGSSAKHTATILREKRNELRRELLP